MTLSGGVGRLLLWSADVPVDPDAPEARAWLREELAKPAYQAAKPTWFDRLSRGFLDWLGSLAAPGGDGTAAWVPVVLTILFAAIVVAATVIFGVPRLNRRVVRHAELFGVADRRSAEDMRRAAEAAAASGNWNLAAQESFRAIARTLDERTIVRATPGTTAHGFAARAALALPAFAERLERAASVFDSVRYLDRDATESDYRAVAQLEDEVRSARLDEAPRPAVSS